MLGDESGKAVADRQWLDAANARLAQAEAALDAAFYSLAGS
jgi:hypothetical protein